MRTHAKARSLNPEKGFVLIAVLFLIAFLCLGVAYLSNWAKEEIESTKILRKKSELSIEAASLKANFLFYMLTKRLSQKGLELTDQPIRPTSSIISQTQSAPQEEFPYFSLFNKPYKSGNLIISIQDEAGLLNLSKLTKEQFNHLFELFDIDQGDYDSLYWKFKDYVKAERAITKQNILGATIEDYVSAGKPEPANEPLRTPFEPKRILDWDSQENFYKNNRLAYMITTENQKPLNINTAQKEILSFIQGLNAESISKILDRRNEETPFFKSNNDVANATGLPLNQLRGFGFLPSQTQRVTITSIAPNLLNFQFSVSAKPRGNLMPWQINYQFDLPYVAVKLEESNDDKTEEEKLAELPPFTDPQIFHSENK